MSVHDIGRERLEEIHSLARAGNVAAADVTPTELRALVSVALAQVGAHERSEASRAERKREQLNNEPDICSICDKEIVEGEATRAGQVHWDCWEKVRK